MTFPHRLASGIPARPTGTRPVRTAHRSSLFDSGASPTQELRDKGRGHIPLRHRAAFNALSTLDHLVPRRIAARLVAPVREGLHQSIRRQLERRSTGSLEPVPRRRGLCPEEFFHEYLRPGIPVVLEGIAADWPCCTKWDFDFLDERYGDDPVVLTDGVVPHVSSISRRYAMLRDVLRGEGGALAKYLRFHPMLAVHPELVDDFPLEFFEHYKVRRSLYSHLQFFVGKEGTSTGLHNSQMCNLFVMVHGEKEWVLYPSAYTAYMDPKVSRSVYRLSRHNTGSFIEPALANLDGYRVTLRPGDVLWNPPFYWHSVRNRSDTIGVGYRWNDQRAAVNQSLTMWMQDCCAIDPTWFRIWRIGLDERRRMLRRH